MYRIRRNLLGEAIKSMEAGAFQSFCEAFFRIRNPEFLNLRRHGGTANGKSKPGTPDIIGEDASGNQCAIECSTRSDYWKKPDNPQDWKPIADLRKCNNKLTRCIKVILCCSQEIPGKAGNVISDIKSYAKANFPFETEVWSLANFENAILENPEQYRSLIEDHLKSVSDLFYLPQDASVAVTARRIYRQYGNIPYDLVEETVGKFMARDPLFDPDKIAEEVVKARYSTRISPFGIRITNEPGVDRGLTWDIFDGPPFGRIVALTGQPKVGKSYLVKQLCGQLKLADSEIKWLLCPSGRRLGPEIEKEFEKDLLYDILVTCYPLKQVHDWHRGRIELRDVLDHTGLVEVEKALVVIDNAEHLSDESILRIDDALAKLQKQGTIRNVGVIFISSASLDKRMKSINMEVSYPGWNEFDITKLLIYRDIETVDPIESYARVVTSFSGGHPLVAVAMATKHRSIADLIAAQADKRIPLYDKGLTDEVVEFLFKELLIDNDLRDFVLRASALLSPFPADLVEPICLSVPPPLRTPPKRITELLLGSVLEGDSDGYLNVAYVFRNVAKSYLPKKAESAVFNVAAKHLLSPIGNSLDIIRACDGILYYTLANNLEYALIWANRLLISMAGTDRTDDQKRIVLDRLWVLQVLKMPDDENILPLFLESMLLLSKLYGDIGDTAKSDQYFQVCTKSLNALALKERVSPESAKFLRIQYIFFAFIRTIRSGKLREGLNALNGLRNEDIDSPNDEAYNIFLLVVNDAIRDVDIADIPITFLSNILDRTKPEHDERIALLTACFINIGGLIKAGHIGDCGIFNTLDKSNMLIEACLYGAAAEQLATLNTSLQALDKINQAIETLNNYGSTSGNAFKRIRLLKADILYKLGQIDEAKHEYTGIQAHYSKDYEIFYRAWCDFRIGLIEQDMEYASARFDSAAQDFDRCGYTQLRAVSVGELGICRILMGNMRHGLGQFKSIIETYYDTNDSDFGRATIIAVSILGNIAMNSDIGTEDIKDDKGVLHLGLRRGVFVTANILADARPLYGKICAYYALAEVYRKYKMVKEVRDCANIIMDSEIVTPIEVHMMVEMARFGARCFRDIYEKDISILRKLGSISVQKEYLNQYGTSLYLFWARATYRRIYDWDIKYYKTIAEGARYLPLGTLGAELVAKCMILLLISLAKEDGAVISSDVENQCKTSIYPVLDKLPRDISLRFRRIFFGNEA